MIKVRTSELLSGIDDANEYGFEYVGVTETNDELVINGYKKTENGYESCEIKSFKNCEF